MITLERDEVESIKLNSYKFFKSTLENKLDEYKKEYESDIKHHSEMSKSYIKRT
ncbi:MAG: hypothetical protein RR835_02335 [Peptostreptococcaceae bacterium]